MNKKSKASRQRTAPAARHHIPRPFLALGASLALMASAGRAHAAGGHHAVDDAALLEPGQCQLETWWDRETGGTRTLLHAGPACRIGTVELGLNLDRLRLDGTGTTTVAGTQIKWARPVHDSWSAGVVIGLAAQDHAPRFIGSTVVVPVT